MESGSSDSRLYGLHRVFPLSSIGLELQSWVSFV
jgi:hypothetical protein